MSLTMNKVIIQYWVLFALLVAHKKGTDAHKISKRSSISESESKGYTSLTRKIVESLSSYQPSWAPRDQHPLLFLEPTSPPRREEQQGVVAAPLPLPLQQGNAPSTEDNSGDASSKFAWSVDDPPSGNNYGHHESRTGDNVDGGYYTLLPDGRVLRVGYHVDPTSGFVATIHYNQSDVDTTNLGKGRQDNPQSQVPPETLHGGDSSIAGLGTFVLGDGTAITFNAELPAGIQSDDGNQENLSDDNVYGNSSFDMPDADNTAEKDEEAHGYEKDPSTISEMENAQPNSDNDQPDPIIIPIISGEQGINNFLDTELQILLDEALTNYTDTEESPLPVDSNISNPDISSFNGNEPNSGPANSNSFPTFPDINLSDIFNIEPFPTGGFDPKFPPPPVFIPLDDNTFE